MAEAQLEVAECHLVKRSDFAKLVGVSRAAVTIAIGAGRLTGRALGPGKKLALPFAKEQWYGNRSGEDGAATAKSENDESDDDEDTPGNKTPEPGTIAYEKYRSFLLKNDRLQMELAVERAALVPKRDVEHGLTDAGAKIAGQIDAIAGWAEVLAAIPQGDTAATRALLKAKAADLRKVIAQTLAKLNIDGSASPDDDDDGSDD